MMRKLNLMLCLLCLSSIVYAQDGSLLRKHLTVGIGSAIPINDFKKDRVEAAYSPMARSGLNLQASYAQDVKPFAALGGSVGWRRNAFDLDSFARPDDELVLSRSATAWQTGYALADVYLQARGLYWFGYLKGSLGVAHSRSPEVEIATRYGPIRRTSDTTTSLAYGLASGIGLEVDRVVLSLEVGKLSSNPTFEVSDGQSFPTRYKQNMSTLQYAFRLGYTLY